MKIENVTIYLPTTVHTYEVVEKVEELPGQLDITFSSGRVISYHGTGLIYSITRKNPSADFSS